jgi:hypothetical protein
MIWVSEQNMNKRFRWETKTPSKNFISK